MLNKFWGVLPTNALKKIHDATLAQLQNRGEIEAINDNRGNSFHYCGLRIKIVVERDFSHWYVYDGDSDPIEIGVNSTEAELESTRSTVPCTEIWATPGSNQYDCRSV
jgi:hypothetical protein